MAGEAYWGYWKHKVEQLWKEMEDLKARVVALEGGAPSVHNTPTVGHAKPALVPIKIQKNSTIVPPIPVIKKTDYVKPVMKLLKERGPMNVVDVNIALKEMNIEESVRDTLFNRLKPLMKKGVVIYDETTQQFTTH